MPDKKKASAGGAADDVKAKMREALEKKHQHDQDHLTAEGARADGSERMHGVEGHVDTQNYRRKAGGGGS
ncbi:DUF5302 family protein [Propionibacteriaceae bacterium Y1685]|uniref:DUF5302 family protein n=1 Tax=Microlunatus sp. Y1700 TaxID=3418487 RepID=UPI003B7E76B1